LEAFSELLHKRRLPKTKMIFSSLGAGDILAMIGGGDAIDATYGGGSSVMISGGGTNLGVGALDMDGDDNILGAGDLGIGSWCSSSGGGVLATGKGGGILCVGADIIPTRVAASWVRKVAVIPITLRSTISLHPELSRLQLSRSAHTRRVVERAPSR
jgi:hypothetical protein